MVAAIGFLGVKCVIPLTSSSVCRYICDRFLNTCINVVDCVFCELQPLGRDATFLVFT